MRTALALLVVIVACSGPATAQDRPMMGMVYNTVETNALTYDCRSAGRDLECSFVQVGVRHKAKPDELAKKLADARTSYPEFVKDFAKECPQIEATHQALISGRPPPGADPRKYLEGTAGLKEIEKADLIKMVAGLSDLCRSPSEAKYSEFVREGHERDVRTCKVYSHSFTQRFTSVSPSGPWVVADSPNGPCGVVNVSRFEAEVGSSGHKFWRYLSKKVVTNPRGEMLPGFACASLDEREYLFDWRSKAQYEGCHYVVFGP